MITDQGSSPGGDDKRVAVLAGEPCTGALPSGSSYRYLRPALQPELHGVPGIPLLFRVATVRVCSVRFRPQHPCGPMCRSGIPGVLGALGGGMENPNLTAPPPGGPSRMAPQPNPDHLPVARMSLPLLPIQTPRTPFPAPLSTLWRGLTYTQGCHHRQVCNEFYVDLRRSKWAAGHQST